MVDSTNPRVMADNIKELAAREVGSTVEANPTGAATNDLEKLEVDGIIYGIPVGTVVEANPEGAATDDLEKLGVGTGIYSIPMYTPPAYSTTEHKTGRKWIDGKDIYEITHDFESDTSFNAGWQTAFTHGNNFETIVTPGILVSNTGIAQFVDIAINDTTNLEIRSANTTLGRYLTFQYTKP